MKYSSDLLEEITAVCVAVNTLAKQVDEIRKVIQPGYNLPAGIIRKKERSEGVLSD